MEEPTKGPIFRHLPSVRCGPQSPALQSAPTIPGPEECVTGSALESRRDSFLENPQLNQGFSRKLMPHDHRPPHCSRPYPRGVLRPSRGSPDWAAPVRQDHARACDRGCRPGGKHVLRSRACGGSAAAASTGAGTDRPVRSRGIRTGRTDRTMQNSGSAGWSTEMTLIDGESAMERVPRDALSL